MDSSQLLLLVVWLPARTARLVVPPGIKMDRSSPIFVFIGVHPWLKLRLPF
jgi:hypothetical protein